MPTLEALHRELSGQGFRFVSVNVEPESPNTVRSFMREQGYTFPVYFDAGALQQRLSVQSYPTSFLLDRRGVVRHMHIGPPSSRELRREIEGLLQEPR
jgi:hypothetical protein